MKTLDEVIEMLEEQEELPCSICSNKEYCHFDDCYIFHALYYLKAYKDDRNDLTALRAFWAEQQENPPLSWGELKQMEGKPVWVEYNIHLKNKELQDMSKTWDIIDHFGTFMDNPVFFTEKGFLFEKGNQGVQWQAYRKERK